MEFLRTICVLLLLAAVDARYKEQHRPCTFNPLCTCSNGGPDLGSVCCHNVPFMTIPSQINNSAMYILSMKNNRLRYISDYSLNGTGLWKLQINNNDLTDIPAMAFAGLEKTLAILDVSENELVRIPKEAIQNLVKLYNLNLAGNHISFFQNEDLRGVSKSLKILDLSDNAIIHINNEAFWNMVSLEHVNLAFNAITSIDDIPFQSSMNNLRHINLMGNQLHQIPLNALSNIKNLKIVNLNENLITYISEGRDVKHKINLEELHLENNLIEELLPESFRVFSEVDRIYLRGNPITVINDTFLTTNITEIYLQQCEITDISPNAFYSVRNSLRVLDLSYNNFKDFPTFRLNKLQRLSVAGNDISIVEEEDFDPFRNSLRYLDIRGPKVRVSQEILRNLPNLREYVTNKQQSSINANAFANYSPYIEKLSIVKGNVKSLENGAFQQFTSLKTVDLSHNSISKITNMAFKDIGHSLDKLILHDALRMSGFPGGALSQLQKLQYLDASRNYLEGISSDALASLHFLKYLNLNHNNIKGLGQNFATGIYNPNLVQLKLGFNKLTNLRYHTFRDLQKLIYLQLNDNLITRIERSAFFNLDSLISIALEGNLINYLENDAFQNLPNMQFISLSYNRLTTFNIEAFDQVGRLSHLRIDVDHNNIQYLTSNYSSGHSANNIKVLDLSHNNISYIENDYFDPIRFSLCSLDLSYNNLNNITESAFEDMNHLQVLDLNHNDINMIQDDEFKGLYNLQILDLSYNHLEEIPERLFFETKNLRILRMSHNNLQTLSRKIFGVTDLEQLDLSYNEFEEFPEGAVMGVKDTLQILDVTGNDIHTLNFSSLKFLINLRYLYIAQNGLHLPATESDFYVPKLISFDLSYNNIYDVPEWMLDSLPQSLESFNLANTSLREIPVFDACNIILLNLSSNAIQVIPSEALEQLKRIQILDLSNNLLPNIYNNLWSNLQQLRSLYLQQNPIQTISNRTFSSMERLQELYINNLNLQEIQKEAFQELTALKRIEMDTYPRIKTVTLPQLFSQNNALREIHLHVQESNLDEVLHGSMPRSLRVIIIEGGNLKSVSESAFVDIQSQRLNLTIKNTNVTSLSQRVFHNMKEVKNFTATFRNNKIQKVERVMRSFSREGLNKNLKKLELSGNRLQCSCDMGWIWDWIAEYEHQNECSEIMVPCDDSYLDNLRDVKCINMGNKPMITAFKTDLNCFSGVALNVLPNLLQILIMLLICSIRIFM